MLQAVDEGELRPQLSTSAYDMEMSLRLYVCWSCCQTHLIAAFSLELLNCFFVPRCYLSKSSTGISSFIYLPSLTPIYSTLEESRSKKTEKRTNSLLLLTIAVTKRIASQVHFDRRHTLVIERGPLEHVWTSLFQYFGFQIIEEVHGTSVKEPIGL